MPKKLRTILSIAGSDPMGGAGIQADIRVTTLKGFHALTALTAVTAQNSKNFFEFGAVPSPLLKLQLEAILKEVSPDAVKIGLIASEESFLVVEDFLKTLPNEIPVVVDTVLCPTKAKESLTEIEKSANRYKEHIFPYSTVITPNLPEFKTLLGKGYEHYWNNEEIFFEENKAQILKELKCKAVILKGGHSESNIAMDTLILQDRIISISHPKIECKNLHGTGCCFSSLLACDLASGDSLIKAFEKTSKNISRIIEASIDYMLGNSNYGPLNINNYKL